MQVAIFVDKGALVMNWHWIAAAGALTRSLT
jgi:hypothetical protein